MQRRRSDSAAAVRSAQPDVERRWVVAASMVMLLLAPRALAFTLHMEYKPPVKSSVSKLHTRRVFSRESSTRTSKTSSPSQSSSSKSAYAAGIYYPQQQSAPSAVASFERRMRDLVLGRQNAERTVSIQQDISEARQSGNILPNLLTIENLEEYKKVVGDERKKMVAVRFYARWCKACKAMAPHFYQMAKNNPDTIFVDVPVTNENTSLHQGLGIPSLPFGHIYHPEAGLVEELKFTRNQVSNFKKTLQCYIQGSCELPDEEDS